MNRRQVLKNLGYGAGALVVTPTIMSLLQSCENEPVFTPVFIGMGEGHALRRMVDLIIPSDEKVPGAVDVGVHTFIDKYWAEVSDEKGQAQTKMAWALFGEKFQSLFNKPLAEGKPEEFDQLLATYLKTTKEERKAYGEKMGDFYQAFEKDPTAKPDMDAALHSFLTGVRGMTTWAWKTSEEIGKNVLWYDPIPAQQIGCIPVSDANGGKVMSL